MSKNNAKALAQINAEKETEREEASSLLYKASLKAAQVLSNALDSKDEKIKLRAALALMQGLGLLAGRREELETDPNVIEREQDFRKMLSF